MSASRTRASKTSTIDGESFPGQVTDSELDSIPTDMLVSKTFTDDDLRSLTSFDQALALTEQTHGEIVDAERELGNGFRVLDNKDKAKLVGVPVILMDWTFNDGNFGKFVSVYLVSKNEDGSIGRWILNDGSTGIAAVLAEYTNKTDRRGGLLVRGGLRFSEYTYCGECRHAVNPGEDMEHKSEHGLARTYYLAV
jgi:hypothetical protein